VPKIKKGAERKKKMRTHFKTSVRREEKSLVASQQARGSDLFPDGRGTADVRRKRSQEEGKKKNGRNEVMKNAYQDSKL